ncbi:MAG: hypothetical protein ABW167_19655 [Baekduia sp.]
MRVPHTPYLRAPVSYGQVLIISLVLLCAVVASTWAIATHESGARQRESTQASIERATGNYDNAIRQWRSSVEGCQRNVSDRIDTLERDVDDARAWRLAATARARTGTPDDLKTSEGYSGIAERAERRLARALGPELYAAYRHDAPTAATMYAYFTRIAASPHKGGRLVNCAMRYRKPVKPRGVEKDET